MSRQEKISCIKNYLSSQLDDIARILVNNQDVEIRTGKDSILIYAISKKCYQSKNVTKSNL